VPVKVILRRRSSLWSRLGSLAAVLCAAVLAFWSLGDAQAADEQHFLDYSVDNFKAVFVSGNLTAAVTFDWPRVVFQHSTNLFAPSFEVSLPIVYLYNDTNHDGVFSRSEAIYTGYLDSHHNVTWNTTAVQFANGVESGEYAQIRMSADVSLFNQTTDTIASVENWANLTFSFQITQYPVTYSNSFGSYTILGRTEMKINCTLDILKELSFTGLAIEHLLKGGGSTNMFMIRENSTSPNGSMTTVSSRVNEEIYGPSFTHRLNQTGLPTQDINFAKEDGTVQAFYRYSSEPLAKTSGQYSPVAMNSSYYTTGTGLILHSSFEISNETTSISHESFLGIDEKGFTSRVRDWLKANLPMIMVVSGSIVAVIAFSTMALMLLRWNKHGQEAEPKTPDAGSPLDDKARPK
jgi:hypothetical protein